MEEEKKQRRPESDEEDKSNEIEQPEQLLFGWNSGSGPGQSNDEESKEPPIQIQMMSSLKYGQLYVNMPSLAKSQKLKDEKILQYLTKLPNSEYKGFTVKQLASRLSSVEARRYLTTLIVLNAQERSNFNDIEEASSNREVS